MDQIRPILSNVVVDPSVFGGPDTYKDIRHKNGYLQKYNNFIRDNKLIPFTIYADNDKAEYIYHFQIQSESAKDVVYDVVIKFFTKDRTIAKEDNLDNYDLQIFSNSPGFTFQFAYVYNKRGILVDELRNKFSEEGLNTPPEKSNPMKAVGYDYTIYFALYYLSINNFYTTKKQIALMGKPMREFDTSKILSSQEVLDIRSPKELMNFKKVTKTIKKTLIDKPKETINDLIHKTGIMKAVKARGGIKATKAVKARKSVRRRK